MKYCQHCFKGIKKKLYTDSIIIFNTDGWINTRYEAHSGYLFLRKNKRDKKQIHARRVERLKWVYEADVMIVLANETRGALAMGYIDSFVEAGIGAKDILQIMTVNGAKVIWIKKKEA